MKEDHRGSNMKVQLVSQLNGKKKIPHGGNNSKIQLKTCAIREGIDTP